MLFQVLWYLRVRIQCEKEIRKTLIDAKPKCPQCEKPMDTLLFMGEIPDGLVCPKCNTLFNFEMKAIGTVI